MKSQELWDFCTRSVAGNDDELAYLRVRLGKTRRGAQTVSSKISVGEDVYNLAEELQGRLGSLHPRDDETIFVELLQSGSSKVSDTYIHYEEDTDLADDYGPTDVECLVKTIERLSISADQRANSSQQNMIRLFERLIETSSNNAMLETLITTSDEESHESVLSQVMTVLEPLLPALLNKGDAPASTVEATDKTSADQAVLPEPADPPQEELQE